MLVKMPDFACMQKHATLNVTFIRWHVRDKTSLVVKCVVGTWTVTLNTLMNSVYL